MVSETTTKAPEGAAPAPAEAPATPLAPQTPAPTPEPQAPAPAEGHTVSPEMAAEVQALLKAQEGQQALLKLRKAKEDACAADIQAVLAKHGCELIVGHQVKVSLATNPGSR